MPTRHSDVSDGSACTTERAPALAELPPGRCGADARAAVAYFASAAPGVLAELHAAVRTPDLPEVEAIARELKVAAEGVGANLVAEACVRLETAAAEVDVDRAAATVRTLAAEVRRSARELSRVAC